MSKTERPQVTDELFYRGAMRRIYLFLTALSIVGSVALAIWAGEGWAIGFLIGAGASLLNFRWLHEVVDSMGPNKKPGRGVNIWFTTRYLLFGAVGYILVRYFTVDVLAALTGLFVAVGAVLLEILYELIYART